MLCGLDGGLYFGPCFYGERLEFQSIGLGLKAGPVGLSLCLISRVLEDFFCPLWACMLGGAGFLHCVPRGVLEGQSTLNMDTWPRVRVASSEHLHWRDTDSSDSHLLRDAKLKILHLSKCCQNSAQSCWHLIIRSHFGRPSCTFLLAEGHNAPSHRAVPAEACRRHPAAHQLFCNLWLGECSVSELHLG